MAFPNYADNYIKSNIYRLKELGKKIYFFTPLNYNDVIDCINMGADGVYVDNNYILQNNEILDENK